ncbi:lymphocyte function-associated antigen 3 isoform X2 [Apus apus]|uniref:lymphocyte function-associated antigen 3 isoform X2 n=1 Tax=Apus apus TaxID=8895 RepID=UPI0021F825E6|nr:lymphocyte function-associated antigen 3 isoform X2 [Apus apus]
MRLLGQLLFFGSFLAHIHCEEVFGIVGENFTFPVKIDRRIVEMTWKRNKNKVAEWEGESEATYYPSLRNRGLLNKENGCLTIYNLESSDNGTYELHYLATVEENYDLTFVLFVLDPPSEPQISCNISGDNFTLKCAAHFQQPLDYTWKFTTIQPIYQNQEIIIPKKSVDASEKATCVIKFSQTEKSSEISLTQCFTEETGGSYNERSRGGLIAALVVFIPIAVILVFLCRRDKELNKEDSAQKDKQMVNNCVNQEDIFKEENSSLLSKHAADHGINEGDLKS